MTIEAGLLMYILVKEMSSNQMNLIVLYAKTDSVRLIQANISFSTFVGFMVIPPLKCFNLN